MRNFLKGQTGYFCKRSKVRIIQVLACHSNFQIGHSDSQIGHSERSEESQSTSSVHTDDLEILRGVYLRAKRKAQTDKFLTFPLI
jgi:hypothetical protein